MNFREDLQQDLDTNPEFRRVWNERAPYRGVIRALVGERIRLGWTQTRLAKQMGTSQANLSRAESRGEASADFLYRFATAVGGSAHLVLHLPATGRLAIDMARLARRQPVKGIDQAVVEPLTQTVTELRQSSLRPSAIDTLRPPALQLAEGSAPPAWWPADVGGEVAAETTADETYAIAA